VQYELVRRAQSGDRDAFDAIASARYDGMYAIARRVLRDGAAAEDAVQEALIRTWRDLRSLRDIDRFDAWSNRLLIRACHDQWRRTRRIRTDVGEIELERGDTRDDYATVGHRDELERAFAQLSIEHRAVVVLTHYLGYSAADVGEILGIPAGTVYSRLHYALRALRSAIGEPDADSTASQETTLGGIR